MNVRISWGITVNNYLRLFDSGGNLIDRPGYMVIAALSSPDLISIEHTYRSMLSEDELNPLMDGLPLSAFGSTLDKKFIRGRVRERSLAGQVVIELVRLAASTGKSPTVNAARRLVSYNHSKHFRLGNPTSSLRSVEKAFREFRNTAHFQATAALDPFLIEKVICDDAEAIKFLGMARGFEEFVDAEVTSDSFKWSPLRVPKQIPPVYSIKIKSLSDEELAVAGL